MDRGRDRCGDARQSDSPHAVAAQFADFLIRKIEEMDFDWRHIRIRHN